MIKDNQNYNDNVEPNTEFLNELKNKLPEYFTKDGEFDLDKFKNNLKVKNINELKDGYQLKFIGKDYARLQSGEKPRTVVVPNSDFNEKNKNSNNLFFSGDNIEVLRHLQGAYQGKIDMIYIDPPYNTGNKDFIYPDTFEYSDDELKDIFGLDNDETKRIKSICGKSSHSAWLTFMYPRLVLAKKLLNENGSIFVSIDDNELYDLKLLMDDIFGEQSFISNFLWNKSKNPPSLSKTVRHKYEYVVLYKKGIIDEKFYGGTMNGGDSPIYNGSNKISTLIFPPRSVTFNIKDNIYHPNKKGNIELVDDLTIENGTNINEFRLIGKFRWKQRTLDEELEKGTKIVIKSDNLSPRYYRKGDRTVTPTDIINFSNDVGTNEDGRKELEKIIGEGMFSFPKPTSLIKYLINMIIGEKENPIILDFFAGSSSTADAVMQLNAEDGKNRKFIMVQLPEKTYKINEKGEKAPLNGAEIAFNNGYQCIDQISRDRIIKSAEEIKMNNGSNNIDVGFKHYMVINPNKTTLDDINNFDVNKVNLFNDILSSLSGNNLSVEGNATGEDTVLSTWLLKDGYSFSEKVDEININGYKANIINDEILYLINEGWNSDNTKFILNKLGSYELNIKSIVLFGYSFNIAEIKELEIGLKQLDKNVNLLKRY